MHEHGGKTRQTEAAQALLPACKVTESHCCRILFVETVRFKRRGAVLHFSVGIQQASRRIHTMRDVTVAILGEMQSATANSILRDFIRLS